MGWRGTMTGGFGALLVCLVAGCADQGGGVASQADPKAGLTRGEHARVTGVIDGDQLILDTGLRVRLAGIEAPRLSRRDGEDWPLAAEAKAALEAATVGRDVDLWYGGQQRDRSGKTAIAHVFVTDETGMEHPVQDMLVDRGLARVRTWADNRAGATRLLAREDAARLARTGIWSEAFYAPLAAAPDLPTGRWMIVEGRVKTVQRNGDRVFLNFGDDWKTDFTVTVAGEDLAAWPNGADDLARLALADVRVRGRVRALNGPLMSLDCPEQIEVLAPASVAAGPASARPARLERPVAPSTPGGA
jgi:endonuclease YncB( thermonuclease family)